MKPLIRRFVSVISFVLAGCSTVPVSPIAIEHGPTTSHTSAPYSGESALAQLRGWYSGTTSHCGSATRPAFLCSGVMMRQVDTSDAYLSWDPSPSAISKGGISFSWLRADSNFPNFWLPNGFIFYPDYDIPVGQYHPAVLCAFPFDGNTWERSSQGCGQHRSDLRSRPCDVLGITTAAAWIDNYYTPGAGNLHAQQCGWNVREGQPATADRFCQNVLARAQLTTQHWSYVNEVILATWPTGSGATLPIHSFFYKTGDTNALAKARSDQTRYYNLYRRALPIFRLTLPKTSAGKAQFAYVASDQAVTPTGDGIQ